jgi:hypothetical protein
MPQEDVTWAREATIDVDATRVKAVCAAEASAQEAAVVWESATALISDAEARAALAEREARGRVSRTEVEGDVALTSTHVRVKDLARRVSLLEDELAEAR